jgi:2-alkenal reductase
VGIVVGFGGFGFAVSSHPVAGQQNIFDSESQALRDLYARVNPSVVNIVVRIPGGNAIAQQSAGAYSYAAGTGFVYDGSNHIVTNAHVVEGADQIELTLSDGTMMYAKLVGADPDSDIAVVTASSDISKYTPLTLADSDSLQIGDRAVAIGNPFENSGTMTQGIVSGLHRTVNIIWNRVKWRNAKIRRPKTQTERTADGHWLEARRI